MAVQHDDLRVQVLAEFKKLPAKEGITHELDTAASVVMVLVCNVPANQKGTPSPAFHRIGKTRVQAEVDRIINYAKRATRPIRKGQVDPVVKLATYLTKIHGPTIDVLASRGVLRYGPIDPAMITAHASSVDLSKVPNVTYGRPANLYVQGVAKVLAFHFHAITGKSPKIVHDPFNDTYGAFVDLVSGVFEIAGIEANALAAARIAVPPIRRAKGKG
ncbi:hypothetical protein [Rhodanobacter sp. DHG33]|uniref:hypothetical protein n=1 Tax=Rhodanobacter sp. DHG33 TaxID=2775921 RepID=UPI00177CEC97|nr:hypothetical protein [Rhodanobacter sp. DHG33]MBD8898368.1 hypothetical protein [Rhodanobacter sp. DHG33]